MIAPLILGAALAVGPRSDAPVPANAVELFPGEDLQAAVDARPAGTTFDAWQATGQDHHGTVDGTVSP